MILETNNVDLMLFELANNINSKDYDSNHCTAHIDTDVVIKFMIPTQNKTSIFKNHISF